MASETSQPLSPDHIRCTPAARIIDFLLAARVESRPAAFEASKPHVTCRNTGKEESRSAAGPWRNTLPFRGSKKQIASIAPSAGNDDIYAANQQIGRAMERLRYEPFGERLAPEGEAALPSRASKYLLWAGTGLFWSLVVTIVIARAVFFEPGVFDEFSRVAALVKAAIF
jgi:hypothetical protein